MNKLISSILLTALAASIASPRPSFAALPQSTQSTSVNSPEAPGDDISFVEPRTVLRFGNDTNFSTNGVAKGDFNGDGKLDIVTAGNARNKGERNIGYFYIGLGNGDGTFQGAAQYPSLAASGGNGDPGTYCPLTRDFDSDGKLDVVLAANTAKKVAFFKGRGDGNFLPYVASDFPAEVNCVNAADLNGDGKLDLVARNYDGLKLMVAFGNGDGTFQTATVYTTHGNPNVVSLGDVNGDGKTDIVYCAYNYAKFGVFLNNGSGGFPATPLQVSIGGKTLATLSLADYSGDGRLDVLATGGGYLLGTSDSVAVLVRGNGNGTFQTPVLADYTNNLQLLAAVNQGGENTAPDLNGDGKPDLVVSRVDGVDNSLTTALNDGSGSFIARNKWAASPGSGDRSIFPDARSTNSFVVGDFNGDGIPDIVTGLANGGSVVSAYGGVAILIGTGNGRFGAPSLLEDSYSRSNGSGQPRTSALQDFTGDGKLDLLSISNSSPILRTGNGDGSFGPSGVVTTPNGNGFEVVTGDVNGDGKLDAVYSVCNNIFCTRNIVVAIGNGNGTFNTTAFNTLGSNTNYFFQNQTLGDFNGDGKQDLALKENNLIEIMLAPFPTSAASVSTPFYSMTLSPGDYDINTNLNNHILAADLDGDGKVDVLAHSRNGNNDALQFFKGNGNGTFAAAVLAGSGYGDIFSYVLRDLDGDGKLDLVAAGNYAVWVAKGVGDGTFFAPAVIGVYGGSQQMTLADFNGDGKPDIVAAHVGGFSVFQGKGDGTFGPPLYFAQGSSSAIGGVMAGDLNGDGKPDLVILHGVLGDERYYESALINNSGPQADLALTMRASRQAVALNTPVRFVATITNTGSSTATGVSLRSLLPATVWAFESAEASQGSCSNAAGVVNCVLGSMAFSTTQVVTITAHPIITGVLAGTASISGSLPDIELGNNSASAPILVTESAPSWLSNLSLGAPSGNAGQNARGENVILMPKSRRTPVTVNFSTDKSKLPGGNSSGTNKIQTRVKHGGVVFTTIETVINVNNSNWVVVIPPQNIVTGPVIIEVTICGGVCGDDDDVIIIFEWVYIILYDPSGIVSDKLTGQPIKDATVTLYKVPGALPDEGGVTKQCRTVDTRPGGASGNWDSLPAAILASGVLPDQLFDPAEISPVLNPQKTNDEGRYGWDVAKGCWFVKVEASGYATKISALVGVPPAVTDLNIKLEKAGIKVFLPLLLR